jgi:hypothetical protein
LKDLTAQPQKHLNDPPQPSTLAQFSSLLLAFIGGGVAGQALAYVFASDSGLASGLSWMMLPLSLVIGMQLWLGFAILSAVFSLIRQLVVNKKLSKVSSQGPPGGALAFIPVASCMSAVVGVIVSFVSSNESMLAVWTAYALTGVGYGVALWQLARKGFLPFPDEG